MKEGLQMVGFYRWLPQTPEGVWALELWLAGFLALAVVTSGILGFLLWQAGSYRGALEKQAVTRELTNTRAELSEAQRRAQDELTRTREELAKAQEALAPRRLTPEQRARLIELLRGQPHSPVHVASLMGDGEGQQFSTQLAGTLREAGWTVASTAQGVQGKSPTGLLVAIRDPNNAPPGAALLVQALRDIGMKVADVNRPATAAGTIDLIVGNKPQ